MIQRVLVVAAALAAASSLAAAGSAVAECSDSHTVAGRETPSIVSVQPSTTQPAPRPAEASTVEAKKGETATQTRTADAKPAVR